MMRPIIILPLVTFFAIAFLAVINDADAQLFRRDRERPLIKRGNDKDPPVAVSGAPFGVGSVSFELPPSVELSVFTHREFTLKEKNNRVFYSVYDHEPLRNALREALNLKQSVLGKPFKVTVYFLFKGNEPLELSLYTPDEQTVTLTPIDDKQLHVTNITKWWEEYLKTARRSFANSEYPQMIDMYLVTMLGQRTGMRIPDRLEGFRLFNSSADVDSVIGTLIGTESVRLAMQKETLLATKDNVSEANRPLPKAVAIPPVTYAPAAADVVIEPIAMHVPQECFYARFGSFNNFQWLRTTMNEWGGDLRNLMAFRGVDYGMNAKMERQLAIRESALSKILGPSVIADVALIGQDTFMREGAGIGILFQAKNNFALSTDLKGHRSQALKDNPTAKEEILDIAGHKVSFIATPDFKVRTFYAVDGDFHLVTSSRKIVERFYEAGAGKRSLGGSEEFRSARTSMPVSRDDTIFAYLSDEFFRTLTAPAFRFEMTRRMHSLAEMDNLRVARLAAKNEQQTPGSDIADLSVDSLIKHGFLPKTFGQRPDGSKLIVENDTVRDSIRGGAGSMIPVGDVNVETCTSLEDTAYSTFASNYRNLWTRMDPVTIGLKRYGVANNPNPGNAAPANNAWVNPAIHTGFRERIVVDVHIAPIPQEQYGFLANILGNATNEHSLPNKNDVFSVEFVAKDFMIAKPAGHSNHYKIGLQDSDIEWKTAPIGDYPLPRDETQIRAYAAAWPSPGLLGFLGFKSDASADTQGIAQTTDKNWQLSIPSLSAVAQQPDLLQDVAQNFQTVVSDRKAQLWLHISELKENKWSQYANAFNYFRARQISAGNLHMLHLMSAQLGVQPEKAKQVVEELLEAKLIDPLNGKYQIVTDQGAFPMWTSTAWKADTAKLSMQSPPEYISPVMKWFRGLDAEVSILPNEFIGRIELEMQHAEKEAVQLTPAGSPILQLPAFPWPNLKPTKPAPATTPKAGASAEQNPLAAPPEPRTSEKQPDEAPAPEVRQPRQPPPAPKPDNGK